MQLFRTARKRNASVWGISQTPEDFVGTTDRPNVYGAGIVKNATTKIIGKQPGDMTALREHVHLNETALNQIKAFAHPKKGVSAEFLIAIGEKAESTHAIRIVPSPVDYWITTTYAREAPSDLKRTVETLERRGTRTGTRAATDITSATASDSAEVQTSDDSTALGLQQRNTLLERQVEALRNTEANLRRRLNDTMAQVEQERSRNQTLKGA